jgi:3-oxoacyl-[acyl-carrier-protein] synthase-1
MPLHDVPLGLAIVRLGLVSSLGGDLSTSCASARAGLSRASELPYTVVAPDGDSRPATGHQASFLTRGFRGDARLVRLLAAALGDLIRGVPQDIWSLGIDAYVALPATFRDDSNQEIDRTTSPWETSPTTAADMVRGRVMVDKACGAAGLSAPFASLTVITGGSPSGAIAFEAAALGIQVGRHPLALVMAADAPVDLDRLASLHARGRLKGPSVPAGVFPGEMGACALVASHGFAATLGRPGVGQIIQPGSLDAPYSFGAGTPPDAVAWATVAGSAAGALPAVGLGHGAWYIVDLNGEPYRSREWGSLVARMRQSFPAVDTDRPWIPALSFGDVGAATALAATAQALQAIARRYAPAQAAIVVNAADGSLRTAFAVAGPVRTGGA